MTEPVNKITYHIGIGGKALEIPIRAIITFEVGGGKVEVSLRDNRVRVRTLDRLIIEPVMANGVNLSVLWR